MLNFSASDLAFQFVLVKQFPFGVFIFSLHKFSSSSTHVIIAQSVCSPLLRHGKIAFLGECFHHSSHTLLTISMVSEAVPKLMGSSSFCFDLSVDCKCISWLAVRTREPGCCIFIPEDSWASVSSKLDLGSDRQCICFQIRLKAQSLLKTQQILFS